MKKKVIISVLALALVLCLGIGGTLAYLTAKTTSLKNTFTYGDINIELTESTGNTYKMIPGAIIPKDPTVTLKEGSEPCYVFVKIEKSANFDEFLEIVREPGTSEFLLEKLDGVDGVYYGYTLNVADCDIKFSILQKNEVKVKEDVTKEMLNALTPETYPTLTFTAYAVQKEGFTAEEAWEIAKNLQ